MFELLFIGQHKSEHFHVFVCVFSCICISMYLFLYFQVFAHFPVFTESFAGIFVAATALCHPVPSVLLYLRALQFTKCFAHQKSDTNTRVNTNTNTQVNTNTNTQV